jgi:hypothetical protein
LKDALAELTSAPAFFDERGEPTPSLKTAAERYTGSRAVRDEARVDLVAALRLLGASDRQIARTAGCDVRLIPLLLTEAETRGRIPALKERVSRLAGSNAEDSGLLLRELLNRGLNGEVSPELAAMLKSTATVLGITVEKVQLLTGGATERIEQVAAAGRDEAEAWAASIRRAREAAIEAEVVVPIDCESAGKPTEQAQIRCEDHLCHGFDTAATPLATAPATAPASILTSSSAQAEGGGGGLANLPPEKITLD